MSSVSYISSNRGRPFLYLPPNGSAIRSEPFFFFFGLFAGWLWLTSEVFKPSEEGGGGVLVKGTAVSEQDAAFKAQGNVAN